MKVASGERSGPSVGADDAKRPDACHPWPTNWPGLRTRVQRLETMLAYYPRLQRVRDLVRSDFSRSISLAQAAQTAAYERSYFSAHFHRRVGIPFTEWIRFEKITQACLLLTIQDYSIWEVAQAVGFKSLRTFERSFKQVVGLTPSRFKVSVRPHLD